MFRFPKMGIRAALPGPTLYSAGQQSSQPNAQFPPSGVLGPAGGKPPVIIRECFLHGRRGWNWLRLGFWPLCFRGGFVLSYPWRALGVGFGRSAWRWFRVHNVGSRLVLATGGKSIFKIDPLPPRRFCANAITPLGGGFQKTKVRGQNWPPTAHAKFTTVNHVWAARKQIDRASKSTLTHRKLARFRRATSSTSQHVGGKCLNDENVRKK